MCFHTCNIFSKFMNGKKKHNRKFDVTIERTFTVHFYGICDIIKSYVHFMVYEKKNILKEVGFHYSGILPK